MEVFMYVYLDQAIALFLYFVVRIRRRRKKFTFAISSADEFLVTYVTARDNNFNKLYLVYVSVFCSCSCIHFYLQVSRFSIALYVLTNM